MLVLPQVNETPSLTIEKLIWHSLKNFGGSLSARRLKDGLGGDYGVTLEQLTKMCDEIKGMETVMFEGDTYHVGATKGGGKKLVKSAEDDFSASARDAQG
jgi:hypothetical protein